VLAAQLEEEQGKTLDLQRRLREAAATEDRLLVEMRALHRQLRWALQMASTCRPGVQSSCRPLL
jgi:hypothetical protein